MNNPSPPSAGFLLEHIASSGYRGWDPYDVLNCSAVKPFSRRLKALSVLLTQLNRISPINFRPLLSIKKGFNSKAMALILYAILYSDDLKQDIAVDYISSWLTHHKSDTFKEYTIGFTFDIALKQYYSSRGKPSLIITLFVMYAFLLYYKKTGDQNILAQVMSFYELLTNELPQYETKNQIWYSYNFEKINEIYNATAKVGKFFSLLYEATKHQTLINKIEKILNYLKTKQRPDGSWAYGKQITYTDGFHTAFVIEAIWHMLRVVDSDDYREMFNKGLSHYKTHLFKSNGQPLYFHPQYSPKDIRRYLIETDIRDCAMAIVLFSKLKDKARMKDVLSWTLKNMYHPRRHYFYYYKNRFWTNKIEFIRWQAWMLYALSHAEKVN